MAEAAAVKAESFEDAFAEAVKEDEPAPKEPEDKGTVVVDPPALPGVKADNDDFAVPEDPAKATADKAAADAKVAAEKITADKAAADAKAAEEKAAADKAAADKAAADAAALAADPAAAKAAADAAAKAEADRAAKEAADKAVADAASAKAAADKAAADAKVAAEKAAADEAARQAAMPKFDKTFEPTAEEKAALEEFTKEWGKDVAPGVAVLLKKQAFEMKQEFSKALFEVVNHFTSAVRPIASSVQQSAEEKHFAAIRSAHADFETVLPEVEKWVAAQPAYLKTALEATLDGGTATDVIDLMNRYKKETGAAPAGEPGAAAKAADKAAADAAAASKAAADAAAAAAAASLAPVKSGGAAPKPGAGVDKNNFGEAWEQPDK
jgi:hypothetical protein